MLRYFTGLSAGKTVLWCYLLWYLTVLFFYFDPSPRIWINSAGISVVIGIALLLSVAGTGKTKTDHWQTFRLFAMPFCVSSFSSLIKGQGFVLILPPTLTQMMTCAGVCLLFAGVVSALKRLRPEKMVEAVRRPCAASQSYARSESDREDELGSASAGPAHRQL